MSKFIYKTLLRGLLFVTPASLAMGAATESDHASHHQPKSDIITQSITDSLWLVQGGGGNIVMLKGDDGLLLVDAEYQNISSSLQQYLQRMGLPANPDFVINTHWHGDHTGGNHAFGKEGLIVAHDNVRQRLSSKQQIPFFNAVVEPYPKHALPDMTYSETMTVHVNNETIHLYHLPSGHTDGDTVVHFADANVWHLGDHFFNGMFPFVDVVNGGNAVRIESNIRSLLARISDDAKIVPGHGPMTDKKTLIAYADMLKGTIAEISALIKQDKLKDAKLSSQWQPWAKGIVSESAWIEIVARSLDQSIQM